MFQGQPPAEMEVIHHKKVMSMKQLIALKVEEAAEVTGIGRNTMRDLIKARKLPILYVGRKHLIRIDALNEFMKLNEGVDLRDIDSVKVVR